MIIQHSQGSYEIRFEKYLPDGGVVVTDSNVAALYPELLGENPVVFPAGEESKNLSTYEYVTKELLSRGVRRKSRIVALGGGVVGDLVGFVAATYMRGIQFKQVPTTLLAQVDSSVGGKVGIDLQDGKNLIGAFHPPAEVFIDTGFLQTLPPRQVRCGMAEVVKYGWIMDANLISSLATNQYQMEQVVERCIQLKADVVVRDEFENKGIRAWLNFGHTIGHAIEQITRYALYTHGEAISIGMVQEARIAEQLGLAEMGLASEVATSLTRCGLPTDMPEGIDVDELIQVMRRDKKSEQSELTMSLVREVGKCELVKNIPAQIVAGVLRC